jgi:fatty acid-binding protein DegV
MSNSKVTIIWGSSADVPDSFRQKFEHNLVPLKLTIDDISYDDRVEMAPQPMYNLQRIGAYKAMSTGGASPATFHSTIARACDTGGTPQVLVIVLQRVLSQGTWAGVTGGIKMLNAEQKDKTHLFMTNHTTCHEGALVMRAHELAAKGHSAEDIKADLSAFERDQSVTALLIRDVTYGRKTGRLTGALPEFLLNNMQSNNKGVAMGFQFQKYKKDGNAKPDVLGLPTASLDKLQNNMVKYFSKSVSKFEKQYPGRQYDLILGHTARPDMCSVFETKLRQDPGIGPRIRHVHYAVMGGVLGVHFGPGGAAIELVPVIGDILATSNAPVKLGNVESNLSSTSSEF